MIVSYTFQTIETPLISILGIGEDSKKYIKEIKDWNSPLVSAKVLDRDFTGPETGIEAAILIMTEKVDATVLAKNLKQSGLLTVIVATREIEAAQGSYDSIAMVSEDEITGTVKTIAEIMTKPSKYMCLDYNDLCHVLKDSGTFQTFTRTSSLEKGGMEEHVSYLKEKLKELPSLQKMLVSITLSIKAKELLKTEDLTVLQKFFSTMPDGIQVLWGLTACDDMPSDELAISAIATQPRYSLNRD